MITVLTQVQIKKIISHLTVSEQDSILSTVAKKRPSIELPIMLEPQDINKVKINVGFGKKV